MHRDRLAGDGCAVAVCDPDHNGLRAAGHWALLRHLNADRRWVRGRRAEGLYGTERGLGHAQQAHVVQRHLGLHLLSRVDAEG